MSDAPSNVIAALALCQAEIGRIDKKTGAQRGRPQGEKGVPYAYRGIEEIAGAAQPLFAKHGVVIAPIAGGSANIDDITIGGNPWTSTLIRFEWRIYGPGGTQDYIEASTWGLGYDNSDKGVNKASTQAYKNLLLRLLTIGDPADEGEHNRPERSFPARPAPAPDPLGDRAKAMFSRLTSLTPDQQSRLRVLASEAEQHLSVKSMVGSVEWLEAVERAVADFDTESAS